MKRSVRRELNSVRFSTSQGAITFLRERSRWSQGRPDGRTGPWQRVAAPLVSVYFEPVEGCPLVPMPFRQAHPERLGKESASIRVGRLGRLTFCRLRSGQTAALVPGSDFFLSALEVIQG